jgi:hypothetical protein
LLLNVPNKATSSITAHFRWAPIAVIKIPSPVCGLRIFRIFPENQPVGAYSRLPVTQPFHLICAQMNLFFSVVYENEVVSRSIHLGEFQVHVMRILSVFT